MKTIHKFPIDPTKDNQIVCMPEGARPISVQVQGNTPCIWAIVDDEEQTREMTISLRGTGRRLDGKEGDYLGTFQYVNGLMILHVFFRWSQS